MHIIESVIYVNYFRFDIKIPLHLWIGLEKVVMRR